MTVSQPETDAAEWNSAIINFAVYTCAFPTPAFQNVLPIVFAYSRQICERVTDKYECEEGNFQGTE